MISDNEKQQIAAYVLDPGNQKRLEIAITVAESYEEIKKQIIHDFAHRLEIELQRRFSGFNIEVSLQRYPHERYIGASITKSHWNGTKIRFSAEEWWARKFIIGIIKPSSVPGIWQGLLSAMRSNYAQGNSSDAWYYYRSFDNFTDWNYEILILLRNPATIDTFIVQFERILSIVEPLIDQGQP